MFPLVALILGFAIIFYGIIDADGDVMMFISIPGLLIVVGGSLAAVAVTYSLNDLKKIPKLLGVLLSKPTYQLADLVEIFERLSQKSRHEGILSLESEVEKLEDEFLKKGIQLVVDGSEADEIKKILSTEIEAFESRHTRNQGIFSKMGILAPGFSMVGTIIGLIVMLANLSSDSDSLGASMSIALITTFYGSIFANLVFDPIASNLRMKTENEVQFKEVMLEGIIMIQSGYNPRVVKENLMTYLSPKEKEMMQNNSK